MVARRPRLMPALAAALAVSLAPALGRAQSELGAKRVSTASGAFLKIGVGARAMGMGGSYVAIADDASSLYWNPAGIAFLSSRAGTFSHLDYVADIDYESVALVTPNGPFFGSWGLMAGMLATDIVVTDENHPFGWVDSDGNAATAGFRDYVAGVTYASRLNDLLSVGVTAKLVREELATEVDGPTTQGVLVDAGILYHVGVHGVKLGGAITNFGDDLRPSGSYPRHLESGGVQDTRYKGYPPPTMFRVGVSYEPLISEGELLLSSELVHPNDNAETFRMGGEYRLRNAVAFRAGFHGGADSESYSLGMGAWLGPIGRRTQIDYAFTDMTYLTHVHRIDVTFSF